MLKDDPFKVLLAGGELSWGGLRGVRWEPKLSSCYWFSRRGSLEWESWKVGIERKSLKLTY